MVRGGVSRLTVCGALIALLLQGCAGTAPTQSSRLKPMVPVDRDAATNVLRTGFSEISQKAIIERPYDDLFIAGYRKLWLLDPEIGFGADENHLTLLKDGEIIARPPRPTNLRGWADTTITLFDAIRESSGVARYADTEALYTVMFDAALEQIDPYSRYAGRRSARANREFRNGIVGLGFTFDVFPEGLVVRSVTETGPLAAAGVVPDDVIIAVDDVPMTGTTRVAAMRLLQGPPQSDINLAVRRASDQSVRTLDLKRSLIIPKTVKATFINGIGRIEISAFNLRTSSDVAKAVAQMKQQSARGLILDLRNDPGGLLDQCVEIADLFLESGVIATLSGRHPGSKQYYEARPGDVSNGLPLIILVDGKSASASEIVAAALSDNGRAVTVGTSTLGKGTVQTLVRLPNDGEMALTWSQVWSPAGYRIHELGVLPGVCTSGLAGQTGDPVANAFRDLTASGGTRERWRTASATADERLALRNLCAAESRPDQDIDFVIAERLLDDRAFFAQAVATNVAASR